MFRYCFLSIIICIVLYSSVSAQDDFSVWTTAGINVPWTSKWKTQVSGEFRSKDYVRQTDLFSLGVLTHYKVLPWLRFGVGYDLFLNKMPSGGFEDEHRLLVETILQYRYDGFTIGWRPRILTLFTDMEHHTWYWRNRVKLDYRFKSSLNPYVSVEPYHFLSGMKHYKDRWMAGVAYDLNKRHQLNLYYLAEIKCSSEYVRNILGVEYYFTL